MFTRYRRSETGSLIAKALVYTQKEHGIDRSLIDPDAVRILEHLYNNGHEGFIVGGAVRDLLLGRKPKDFDLVTDAEPSRVRRIFRNSRIIGRRFRLVHVYIGHTIYEVATFRSIANGTVGNEFGTIDEDAQRRDFTFNALYYDPKDDTLIDYVGGFKDIKARRIHPVIPLATIFSDDPVRMIRCLKYAATTGFRIPFTLKRSIKRDAPLLAGASASRLTEEFAKILASGHASPIIASLHQYGLLGSMLPGVALAVQENAALLPALLESLSELDNAGPGMDEPASLSKRLSYFVRPWIQARSGLSSENDDAWRDAFAGVREFLAPLNPPRVDLEAAVTMVFRHLGISPVRRPHKEHAHPETADVTPHRRRGPRKRSA